MKRQTKQQKETAEKAALRKRIEDIAAGAIGDYSYNGFDQEEFVGVANEGGMDSFARWVGGVKHQLIEPLGDDYAYLTDTRNLSHYDTPAALTEFLYEHGIRA